MDFLRNTLELATDLFIVLGMLAGVLVGITLAIFYVVGFLWSLWLLTSSDREALDLGLKGFLIWVLGVVPVYVVVTAIFLVAGQEMGFIGSEILDFEPTGQKEE